MTPHPLDNPIWASLSTLHRPLALASGQALRYPPQVAPFLGIPGGEPIAAGELEPLVPQGDTALLLGPAPSAPGGYQVEELGLLSQLICEAPLPEVDGPPIVELGEARRRDILELTALVYPHYFRPRTPELGRYFGLFEGERLAAMIGERFGAPGFREVSAVCTHPDFNGRGYARRLLAWLSNDNLKRGLTPFLHVSPKNSRAKEIYLQNGYRTRVEIAFWSLKRR
ncbi:MAG: GNAT family N-acetyltransferase [Myxococcaceae bacterium]